MKPIIFILLLALYLQADECIKCEEAIDDMIEAIEVNDRYGYIKEGYTADLTYVDENYKVKGTVSKGNLTNY